MSKNESNFYDANFYDYLEITRAPLSLTGPLAAALVAGAKTQTRRPFRNQPQITKVNGVTRFDYQRGINQYSVGDLLWLREPAKVVQVQSTNYPTIRVDVEYSDNEKNNWLKWPNRLKSKPIIGHKVANGCFKEAARCIVEITDVYAQQLQDITLNELEQEGIPGLEPSISLQQAEKKWITTWDSIYKKRGIGWEVNPFVWVYSFRIKSSVETVPF